MRSRALAVAGWIALTVLLMASRADACVGCRFELICTKFGQDCQYAEFCVSLRAPQGGAWYCSFDDFGFCYEEGLCQVAQLQLAPDSQTGFQSWSASRDACRHRPDRIG
jgi:hypothetical protein